MQSIKTTPHFLFIYVEGDNEEGREFSGKIWSRMKEK